MRKKTFSTIALIFLFANYSIGQVIEELEFEEKIHDFGEIEEKNGPTEFEFVFTNTGFSPITIENVKASCGCTTPGWSTEEVAVGESGFVKAKYDPRNRPGPFNKSLTITTSGDTKTYVLYIKGHVIPKPRTIEDDFPTVIGGIRVKYRAFNLGKIFNNAAVTRDFEIYNASEDPISFIDSVGAPYYVTISFVPQTLQPAEKGKIIVTYDPKGKNDLGFMSDNVTLYTDEKEDNIKSFSVYASIEEYFPPMTSEDLALAPKLIFEDQMHDFGKIKQGEVVTTEFMFTNGGKTDLNIRKTNATCGCTISKPGKDILKPGETSTLTVTFNSSGRRGSQQKSVTIFSNDPVAPTQRVTIKARIEIE